MPLVVSESLYGGGDPVALMASTSAEKRARETTANTLRSDMMEEKKRNSDEKG